MCTFREARDLSIRQVNRTVHADISMLLIAKGKTKVRIAKMLAENSKSQLIIQKKGWCKCRIS